MSSIGERYVAGIPITSASRVSRHNWLKSLVNSLLCLLWPVLLLLSPKLRLPLLRTTLV
jgi:hypothetical protein